MRHFVKCRISRHELRYRSHYYRYFCTKRWQRCSRIIVAVYNSVAGTVTIPRSPVPWGPPSSAGHWSRRENKAGRGERWIVGQLRVQRRVGGVFYHHRHRLMSGMSRQGLCGGLPGRGAGDYGGRLRGCGGGRPGGAPQEDKVQLRSLQTDDRSATSALPGGLPGGGHPTFLVRRGFQWSC